MASEANGNNGTKLVWWVLGVFGGLVGLFLMAGINKSTTMDDRLRAAEIKVSELIADMKNIKEGASPTAYQARLEVVSKFAELSGRVTSVETSQKLLEDRSKTISDRILAINNRLDKVPGELRQ